MENKEYITSSEIAKLLGISLSSFYRFEKQGYISPTKIHNRQKLYSKTDVKNMAKRFVEEESERQRAIANKRARGSYIYEKSNAKLGTTAPTQTISTLSTAANKDASANSSLHLKAYSKPENTATLTNAITKTKTTAQVQTASKTLHTLSSFVTKSGTKIARNIAKVKGAAGIKSLAATAKKTSMTSTLSNKSISETFKKIKTANRSFKNVAVPFSIGILLLTLPLVYLLSTHSQDALAWYNDNWNYRVKYTLNNTGAADADKKVLVQIDTASIIADEKLQSDCGDSRFTDINGAALDYYIDTAGGACNTATTHYYVLLPTINAGDTLFYHYYGSPYETNGSQAAQFAQATFSPNSLTPTAEEIGPGPIAHWKFDEGYDQKQDTKIEQQIEILNQEYITGDKLKTITITNNIASELTDYQTELTVTYDSDMQTDFSDISFRDSDDLTQLEFWIESYTRSVSATVWVKIPSIPASSSKDIYMYYGGTAGNSSDISNVFIFADDFSGPSLATEWTERTAGGASAGTFSNNEWTKACNGECDWWNNNDLDAGAYIDSPLDSGSDQTWEAITRVTETTITSGSRQMGIMLYQAVRDGYMWGLSRAQSRYEVEQTGAGDRCYLTLTTEPARLKIRKTTANGVSNNNTFDFWLDTGSGWTQCQTYTTSDVMSKVGLYIKDWDGSPTSATYDYFLIKKYASTEPTVSFGTEEIGSESPSTAYQPTNNSLGIIQYDSTKYNSPTVYLESVISTDGTTWNQLRSSAISMPTGSKDYTVRIRPGDGVSQLPAIQLYNVTNSSSINETTYGSASDAALYIKSARLIIVQSSSLAITNTETQIEIGANTNTTSTSDVPLTDKKIYRYTSASYDPAPSTYLEATAKSTITNVDIEQQINIIDQTYVTKSTTYDPTDNSLGIVRWDADKYPGATVYFEVLMKVVGNTHIIPYAALYTTGGSQVSGSELSGTGFVNSAVQRLRTGALTLTDDVDTDYTVRFRVNGTITGELLAARLIIQQTNGAKITDTQTQIDIGSNELQTSTTPTALTNRKAYYYDASKYSPEPTTYFEATIKGSGTPRIEQQVNILDTLIETRNTTYMSTDNSLGIVRWDADKYPGATVYFEVLTRNVTQTDQDPRISLYTTGISGTQVSGSELTGTDWNNGAVVRKRTGALTLVDDTDYTVRIRATNAGAAVQLIAARLIIQQTDTTKITDTQTQIDIGDGQAITDNSYTQLTSSKKYLYDASKFSPAPTAYFEATLNAQTPKIEQQLNISNKVFQTSYTSPVPTDNSLGIVNWDADRYPGATVYFEAVFRGVYNTADLPTVYLYTTGGTSVTSIVTGTWTNYAYSRVRSGALSLSDGTDYTVRIKSALTSRTVEIISSRLIVIQAGTTEILDTDTRIEVGSAESNSSSTATTLTNQKRYYYDSSKFTPAPTTYFEASLHSGGVTLEQQVNLIDRELTVANTGWDGYQPQDNSWGLTKWEASKYPDSTVYFEIVTKWSSNQFGTDGKVALHDSDGNIISASEIQNRSTAYITLRTGPITLENDTQYTVRAFSNGITLYVRSARLVVVQNDTTKLEATETAITVGNYQTGITNTSYQSLTDTRIYQYDQNKFTPTPESAGDIEFSATLKTNDAGDAAYAELYNKTNGAQVTEISHTGDTLYTLVTATNVDGSANWDTTNDDEYEVRVRCSDNNGGGCSANISNAKIHIYQSDASGITDLETARYNLLTPVTDADATYTLQNGLNPLNIDYGFTSGALTITYEATMKTSAGTGYTQLYNIEGAAEITGSEISTTSTSYERVRSSDIASNLLYYPDVIVSQTTDSSVKNGATNTTSVSISAVMVQVTDLSAAGFTAYADLYNVTDGTAVTGSEISANTGGWALVKSSAITLTTGKEYVVRTRSSINNRPIKIANAKIVQSQTSATGITDLQIIHPIITTNKTDSDTTYSSQSTYYYFNPGLSRQDHPSFTGGVFEFSFQSTMKTSAGTGYVQLYNYTNSSEISGSELSTTSTTYERVVSSDITSALPSYPTTRDGKTLDSRLKNASTNTTTVSDAGLIINVSGLIDNGSTAYAELYNVTDGVTVTNSEITSTQSTTYSRQRSAAITLTTNKEYVVRVKSSAANLPAYISNAKIILEQSDANGITDLETIQQQVVFPVTDSDVTYTQQSRFNVFNPGLNVTQSSFGGADLSYSYEAIMKTSAGTGYAKMYNTTGASEVNNSEISTASTSYERVRSGDITADLPTYLTTRISQDVDTIVKNSATNTTTVASSYLIVQVNNLVTEGSPATTAELYNDTDDTVVSGSQITSSTGSWELVRSSAITLTTGKEYIVRLSSDSATSGGALIANAKIIHDQTDANGITKLQTMQQQVNNPRTDSDGTYSNLSFFNEFNPVNVFAGGTFEYYYEANMKTSAATGFAEMYNSTASASISGSEITTTSTAYERVRSSSITDALQPLTTVTLDTRIKNASDTTSIASSWLIVDIANLGTPTVIVSLYENGSTCANQVTNSEVTVSGTSWTRTRGTSAIALSSGTDYMACFRTGPGMAGYIENVKIVHDQTDTAGITSTELYHTYTNTASTDDDATYTSQQYPNTYTPSNFTGDVTTYFEATAKTSAGTGYIQLYDNTNTEAKTGSEMTTTSTSYERLRTPSAVTLPSSSAELDVQIKNAATDTTTITNAWMVIQVTNVLPAIAHDSTANSHDGAITGAVWQSPETCISGSCLAFDGTDDNIWVADGRKLDFSQTDDFTLNLWFRNTGDASGINTILEKYESTGSDGGYALYMNTSGNIVFGVADDNSGFPIDSVTSTSTLNDSRWHHVTAIKENTTSMSLYIDGVLEDSETTILSTGSLANNDPLYIGIGGDGASNPWNGSLDDVKIYPYARSTAEMETDMLGGATNRGSTIVLGQGIQMALNDGLAAEWKMDETAANSCSDGKDICDTSGNELDGTFAGDTSFSTGKLGNAISFDGTGDGVNIPSTTVKDSWYDISWTKRAPITITNNTTNNLTDYQTKITVTYDTDMNADFSDLRFTNVFDDLLDYWIESKTDSTTATVWVEVDAVPASSTAVVYMYYGNSSATSTGNGSDVFQFFDDFSGASLSADWSTSGGTWTQENGVLTQSSTSTAEKKAYVTTSSANFVVEALVHPNTLAGDYRLGLAARVTTNSAYSAIIMYNNLARLAILDDGANWGSPQDVGFTYATNNWYKFVFAVNGSNQYTKSWLASSEEPANWITTQSYTSRSVATAGLNGGYQSTASFDNFFVRQYASIEPTSSVGTEESATSTNNPDITWYDLSWAKRSEILFTNNVASELTNHQVSLSVPYATEMNADFSDLRFTASDKTTLLDYWVEDYTASDSATVWVEVGTIPASSTATIYMYYGNSAASSASNGTNTFVFFDSFDDNDYSSTWEAHHVSYNTTTSTGLTLAETGQQSTISGSTGLNFDYGSGLRTQTAFSVPLIYEIDRISYSGSGTRSFGYSHVYQDANNWISYGGGIGYNGDANNIARLSRVNSSQIFNENLGVDDYGSHEFRTVLDGTNSTFYIDGTSIYTQAASTLTSVKVGTASWLRASTDTIDVRYDNARVREYASTEPSVALVETEMVSSAAIALNTNITVSTWVNATTLDANARTIITRGESSTQDWYIQTSATNTGQLEFSVDGGTTTGLSNTVLSTSNWYNVAMTYDGSKVKLYINGILDTEYDQTGSISENGDLAIGNLPSGGTGWAGLIDETRIYNKALSAEKIFTLYRLPRGPVGYYPFDDGEKSSVADKSSHNYSGSWSGTGATNWTPGKIGWAGNFNGTSDYVSTNDTAYDFTGDFTLTAWVKRGLSTGGTNTIISKLGAAGGGGFALTVSDNGAVNCLTDNGTTTDTSSTATGVIGVDSDWTHITATRSGTSCAIYINTVDATSTAGTHTTLDVNDGALRMGSSTAGENFWSGKIDEVKIYDYAIESDQLLQNLNASHPIPGSPVGSAMLELNFDEGYGTIVHNTGNGGSSYNGTFAGVCPAEATCPTWTDEGKFNKAISFDGGDYITTADIDFASGPFTVIAWFKTDSATQQTIIRKRSGTTSDNGGLRVSAAGNLEFFIHDGTDVQGTYTAATAADGNWHMAALVVDDTTAQVFMDGKPGESASHDNSFPLNDNTWTIGRTDSVSGSPGEYFTGSIDSVKIYNVALDTSQLAIEYNQAKAINFGNFSTAADGTTPSTSASRAYCIPGDTSTCRAPVGEWLFNENTGTSTDAAKDTSENSYDGNMASSMTEDNWVPGKVGSALLFTGNSTDRVEINNPYNITEGLTALTVSAWIKPNFTSTANRSYGIFNNGKVYLRFNPAQDDFSLSLSTTSGSIRTDTASLSWNTDEWYHITAVYDGSYQYIYWNGQKVAESAQTGGITVAGVGYIGADASGAFDGIIDEVRLFDYAQTPAQIAWNYNRGAPFGWWRIDECSGTTLNDASGNGNNGTLYPVTLGNTTAGTCNSGTATEMWDDGTTGRFNGSVGFDGSDDYASIANESEFDFASGPFAISLWFKTSQATEAILAAKDSAPTSWNWGIWSNVTENGTVSVSLTDGTAGADSVTTTLPSAGGPDFTDGSWHHAVMNVTSTTIELFVDGKSYGTDTHDNTFTTNNNPIMLGKQSDGSGLYEGQIDDFRVYTHDLTGTQIKEIYTQGTVHFAE